MKLNAMKVKVGSKKARRRVGRGNASGAGTYCGRGSKGQGQRKSANVRPGFEGGQTSLISRLPKLRGFNNPNRVEFQIVNVRDLDRFSDGDEVNVQSLLEKRLVSKKDVPVKLLGMGKVEKKVTVRLQKVSGSAREKIVAAGGKVL